MRFVMFILLILIVVLQYKLWFENGALHQVEQLRQEVAKQKEQNVKLVKQNDQLHAEVKDLKQGIDAAEEKARDELGMTKSNEEYIQVVQQKNRQDRQDS